MPTAKKPASTATKKPTTAKKPAVKAPAKQATHHEHASHTHAHASAPAKHEEVKTKKCPLRKLFSWGKK